jgi:2-amino-4-hydroxy-6-hydroxymethyldihydropteridine diphosphokinase
MSAPPQAGPSPEEAGPSSVTAHLGLGSNQGDRVAMLREALTRLEASKRVRVRKQSSLYETAPLGVTAQPWFLNLVAEVQTDLRPLELLDLVLIVEQGLGRVRTQRWGPRTIDIDILLYGDLAMTTAALVIPHPEMTRRRFVLEPLIEIAPDVRLPGGQRVASLLDGVRDQAIRKVPSS